MILYLSMPPGGQNASLGRIRFGFLFGDGIVAAGIAGMAAADTFDGQPGSLGCAEALEGFDAVLGAGGGVAAGGGQVGRKNELIAANQGNEGFAHPGLDRLF
jgi:hypothetical protein